MTWDHPRTCRENSCRAGNGKRNAGSPPHLRGKRKVSVMVGDKKRITPAPAGKTKGSQSFTSATRDHPRTCGENTHPASLFRLFPGSPPHLRGKLQENSRDLEDSGITPAPAGKTVVALGTVSGTQDHPRTCGENVGLIPSGLYTLGSPPHLRGKLLMEQLRSLPPRITPAPAGKTLTFLVIKSCP